MRFFKTQRIKKQSEFEKFKTSKARLHCSAFSLCFIESEKLLDKTLVADSLYKLLLQRARFATITSRKVGNSVERNSCKRKLREIFRKHQADLRSDGSYLVICRRPIIKLSLQEIDQMFVKLIINC